MKTNQKILDSSCIFILIIFLYFFLNRLIYAQGLETHKQLAIENQTSIITGAFAKPSEVTITIIGQYSGYPPSWVRVDGVPYYEGSAIFTWMIGSQHTIDATSPICDPLVPAFKRWVFEHWSDGGPQHYLYITPATNDTLEGVYQRIFRILVISSSGGHVVVDPDANSDGGGLDPTDGWYNYGTAVRLDAVPDIGYTFQEWEGYPLRGVDPYPAGTENPKYQNGPIIIRPIFTPVSSSIAVISPNGDEIWPVGTSQSITWSSAGTIANVRIELSRNGGLTWEDIIGSTTNDGTYNWILTGPASGSCRIRISSKENSTISDVSNENFIITEGQILFFDNFEDGNADGWSPNTPSRWSVVQDEGDYSYFLNSTGYSGGERTLLQGYSFNNFELTLKTKSGENLNQIINATYTIHFCYQNEDNYYSVKFCQYSPENKLYRKKDGQTIVLASFNGITIDDNDYHQVKLKRDGNNILVYFDQQLIMSATDNALSSGQIGLGAWQNSAYFDDILITTGIIEPILSVTPNSINIDYIGGSNIISVSNIGNGIMNWSASVTSGSNWLRITSGSNGTNNGTINFSVDPNSSSAQRTGEITVTAPNATGSPKIVYIYQNAGTSPDISLNPTSWNYGSVNIGSYSDKTFIIRNDGNANLNVTSTSITGANALEFSIQSGGGSFTLNPGAIRNLVVRFSPTSAGGKSASLSIANNDYDENPLIVNLSGGTGPEWKVPITITAGNVILTRTFGGDANATDGFDSGLDVAAAPPGMTYYAYFELPVFPSYLETDIRNWVSPYTAEISWTLKIVNATGITSSLTWNPSELPTALDFILTGPVLNINMKSQNSATVSNSASLTIKYGTFPTVYTFPQQGWYLISLPVTPTNNNLSALFPTAIAAFGYNSATGSYYAVTTLEAKKGYWLLIPGATTATISGTRLNSFTEHYNMGWHLIGTVRGTTNFTDPKDNPNGAVLSAWGYNPATSQYVQVYPPGIGILEEKQGYWLAMMQSSDLTIGGGGMAEASIAAVGNNELFKQQFGSQPPIPPFIADGDIAQLLPKSHKIVSRNYPNPFNPETVIEYLLPKEGLTQVCIYNSLGQKIRTLMEAPHQAGAHQANWDGRNDKGELVTNGIYYYKIINAEFVETQKMLLLK